MDDGPSRRPGPSLADHRWHLSRTIPEHRAQTLYSVGRVPSGPKGSNCDL